MTADRFQTDDTRPFSEACPCAHDRLPPCCTNCCTNCGTNCGTNWTLKSAQKLSNFWICDNIFISLSMVLLKWESLLLEESRLIESHHWTSSLKVARLKIVLLNWRKSSYWKWPYWNSSAWKSLARKSSLKRLVRRRAILRISIFDPPILEIPPNFRILAVATARSTVCSIDRSALCSAVRSTHRSTVQSTAY